jgi:hypothetical protein
MTSDQGQPQPLTAQRKYGQEMDFDEFMRLVHNT